LCLFFVGKMKTISDAEFASYLLRAKQKMDTPETIVDPLSQVIVAGDAGKGLKRGRRAETAIFITTHQFLSFFNFYFIFVSICFCFLIT
jgi:hypothetical protein